jgi:hypothetical protein
MNAASTANPIPYAAVTGVWLDDWVATDNAFLRGLSPLSRNRVTSETTSAPLLSPMAGATFNLAGEANQLFTISSTEFREFCGLFVANPAPQRATLEPLGPNATAPSVDPVMFQAGIKLFAERANSSTTFASGLVDMQNIVAVIRDRSPLRLSDRIEALIERAVQARGTPDNVEDWARRLANDVRDLTD